MREDAVTPIDRTPPTVRPTQTAAQLLRRAIDSTGNDTVAEITVDAQFRSCPRLVPRRQNAIATIVEGVPLQFDLASARRAKGLSIDCDETISTAAAGRSSIPRRRYPSRCARSPRPRRMRAFAPAR